MSASIKGWLIAGFVLVFLAGGTTGWFLGARHWRHLPPESGHHPIESHLRRLQVRLQLSPEQAARSKPIFDRTIQELQAVRKDSVKRIRKALFEMDRDLVPLLSPEQRDILKKIEQEHRHDHGHGHLHGGRQPPPPQHPEEATSPSAAPAG